MDANFIRERITQLRLQRQVSEYQMSYDLGQSKGYIQSITSGRALPSMAMLLEICDYFGVTPSEFFDEQCDAGPKYHAARDGLARLSEEDLDMVGGLIRRLGGAGQ